MKTTYTMELKFDIRGNLRPYEKIELTLDEFKENFVDLFEETSSGHENRDYSKTVSDLLYWEHWFGKSKKNRATKG